jgi:molybdopterin/thiamine biosynthesis adenylyltransferase
MSEYRPEGTAAGAQDRYVRHRPLISDDAWERLTNTRVIFAGVGGLGANAAQIVARLGPVTLELWDPGILDEPDLNRQILYRPEHLGTAKVDVAARELQAINPEIRVEAHQERISAETFARAHGAAPGDTASPDGGGASRGPVQDSIIMDCLDSFEARAGLEDIRRAHGIPVVHGGIEGWYGQVVLFPGRGPGYEAVYGPDFRSMPPAGKPMMPQVVTSIASMEVGLLIDWFERGTEITVPEALYVYDGKELTLNRIELNLGDLDAGGAHGGDAQGTDARTDAMNGADGSGGPHGGD